MVLVLCPVTNLYISNLTLGSQYKKKFLDMVCTKLENKNKQRQITLLGLWLLQSALFSAEHYSASGKKLNHAYKKSQNIERLVECDKAKCICVILSLQYR